VAALLGGAKAGAGVHGPSQSHHHPVGTAPDVLPRPADDDEAERLERLLPQLLGPQRQARVLVVVLHQAVGLADDAELLPVKVDDAGRAAVLVDAERDLQLGRRHVPLMHREPADALQWRLRARIAELHRCARPSYAGPSPAATENRLELVASAPEAHGR